MARAPALALLATALFAAGAARAETDRERAAKEIDQQMKELVKSGSPPVVRVYWEGADSNKVALDEARFELDDARLSYGDLDALDATSKAHRPIYDGQIETGKHQLAVGARDGVRREAELVGEGPHGRQPGPVRQRTRDGAVGHRPLELLERRQRRRRVEPQPGRRLSHRSGG